MELSQAALGIIVLMIPGIVSKKFFEQLSGKAKKNEWEDIFEIILISIISYLLLSFSKSVLTMVTIGEGFTFQIADNLQASYDNKLNPNFIEIVYASITGIVLAFLWSYVSKHNLINNLGMVMGASQRYGNEDVWDHFLSENDKKWLIVRDLKSGMNFNGYAEYFSESEKDRELVLSDVSVYKCESIFEDTATSQDSIKGLGKLIYETKKIYISINQGDLIIEVEKSKEDGSDGKRK